MLTLKKVKEMVKAPVHTKRVPSPKVLLEDGRILLRKEFEHDSHLTLYHNGYVWFSAGKRNTVFHIHDCRGDYHQTTFRVMEASEVRRLQRIPCRQVLQEIFDGKFIELKNGMLRYKQ